MLIMFIAVAQSLKQFLHQYIFSCMDEWMDE